MLVLIIVFFIGISLLSIGLCIHFFASKYEVNYFDLYMDKASELITAEENIESLELQLREQDKLIDKYNKQIAKLKEEIKVLKRELKKVNKNYICKGCGATLSITTMSCKQNYCKDCYDFYKHIMKNT